MELPVAKDLLPLGVVEEGGVEAAIAVRVPDDRASQEGDPRVPGGVGLELVAPAHRALRVLVPEFSRGRHPGVQGKLREDRQPGPRLPRLFESRPQALALGIVVKHFRNEGDGEDGIGHSGLLHGVRIGPGPL